MKPTFDQQLKVGRIAETEIVRWLRSRGNSIISCYEIEHKTGKGPQFLAPTKAYVAPDILAFGGSGKVLWCETKRKTVFSWYYKGKYWTTGIDLRHYKDYQKVAEITGLPVWLLFFHVQSTPNEKDRGWGCPSECPTGLYAGDVENLSSCESHRSDRHGPSGMVYWPENALKRLASVDEVQGPTSLTTLRYGGL